MRATIFTVFTLLLMLPFLGCSSDPQPQTADVTEPTTDESEVTHNVAIEIKSWDELQQWVAAQKGKVVVIDVWSTSCLPCLKEFPHFVELHEKHGDEIACASLSVDFYGGQGNKPEDVLPAVQEFLNSRNATMKNFVSSDPDEVVLEKIDTAVIPAALVYNQQGKLAKRFNNDGDEFEPDGFNYEDHITPLVEKLLQQQ